MLVTSTIVRTSKLTFGSNKTQDNYSTAFLCSWAQCYDMELNHNMSENADLVLLLLIYYLLIILKYERELMFAQISK